MIITGDADLLTLGSHAGIPIIDPAEAITRTAARLVEAAADGTACPTVTGAGTGSFEFETATGVYTELQCGSYIFMDAD